MRDNKVHLDSGCKLEVRSTANVGLLCEVAVLEHHSFNLALLLIRITRVQISTSPAILQSKC